MRPSDAAAAADKAPQTSSSGELDPIPGLVDGVYFSGPTENDRVWRLAVSNGGTSFIYSQSGCEVGPDLEYDEFMNIRLSYGRLILMYGNANTTDIAVTVDGDKVDLASDKLDYFNADLEKKDASEAEKLEEEFCFPQ